MIGEEALDSPADTLNKYRVVTEEGNRYIKLRPGQSSPVKGVVMGKGYSFVIINEAGAGILIDGKSLPDWDDGDINYLAWNAMRPEHKIADVRADVVMLFEAGCKLYENPNFDPEKPAVDLLM